MKFLITGGAGYIGSHMVKYAQDLGHEVVVIDDFSTGHYWALKDCEILNINLLDHYKLSKLVEGRNFDGVIHFAAKSLVGESVKKPELYYQNNVTGTLNLVREMLKNDINNLVFSSSAAIFGNSDKGKIAENHAKQPINPYGESKLMVERILQNICLSNDFNAVCLRYFNAAGADSSGKIGEAHNPETHLIPNILKSAILNDSNLKIFGNDYPTPDGYCIRDYVHVTDLAKAHLLSYQYMQDNIGFSAFNLGNGDGFSVLDVIKSCEKALNRHIPYEVVERRTGDPAMLVADNSRAKKVLGWDLNYSSLDNIVASALDWHKSQL